MDLDTLPGSRAAGAAVAPFTAAGTPEGHQYREALQRVLSGDGAPHHPHPDPIASLLGSLGEPPGGGAPHPHPRGPCGAGFLLSTDDAAAANGHGVLSAGDAAFPGKAAAAGAGGAGRFALEVAAGSSASDDGSSGSDGGDPPLPMPEPFKIKMVESISLLPRRHREERLKEAGYNVFCLKSSEVFIDLLTDSGMSAQSDRQWGAMMMTPQAYAGSSSFFILEDVVRDLMGFKHILPEHQGRAAENVLFSVLVAPKPGCYVPNNTHFDTTEANVLRCGGHPVNFPIPEAYDTATPHPFKGNMDVAALEAFLTEKGPEQVPVVMMTVTNNSMAGQPVSMDNVRQVSALCKRFGVPFFIDAARFAENCYFVQRWEPGYENRSIADIARELFSLADGCTFSGKKEALANVGGLLCCNDDALYEQLRNLTIVIEGFRTYGGLACRDLMAMAEGLREVVGEAYQEYRHNQIELLARLLREGGVPIVEPPGGHAIYVDATRFLPHVPAEQFPAQALTAALYAESGVRGVEIGSSCFGHTDPDTGAWVPARLELLRLAVPRRVYTDNHLRYVAAALSRLYAKRHSLTGLRRVYATRLLSHFTARFEPAAPAGLLLAGKKDAVPANEADKAGACVSAKQQA